MASQEIIIEANRANRQYWLDLWHYRELFLFLAWRDISVRYKQTALGIMWSVLRPTVAMVAMTLVFGKLAKLPSGNVPYPIMVYTAMLPWQFFANALSECSNSLVSNTNLITKIYFPRLIIPTSSVILSFIDFLVAIVILGLLMLYYGFAPTWNIVFLPLFTLLTFAAAFGGGIWMASLNVKYRDFRFIVPFIVQFGLYLSPVGYISSIVPGKWRFLYSLNPMAGVIDGFRWAVLGGEHAIYIPGLLASILIVMTLVVSGLFYFRRTERTFADII